MTTITHFSLPPPSAPSLLILSPPISAQPLTYLQSTLKGLKNLAFPTKVQISEVHCNKLYVLEESIVRLNEIKGLRKCPTISIPSLQYLNKLLRQHSTILNSKTSFPLLTFPATSILLLPSPPSGLLQEVNSSARSLSNLKVCLTSGNLRKMKWRDDCLTRVLYSLENVTDVAWVGEGFEGGKWYHNEGTVKRSAPTFSLTSSSRVSKKPKTTTTTTTNHKSSFLAPLNPTPPTRGKPSKMFSALTPGTVTTVKSIITSAKRHEPSSPQRSLQMLQSVQSKYLKGYSKLGGKIERLKNRVDREKEAEKNLRDILGDTPLKRLSTPIKGPAKRVIQEEESPEKPAVKISAFGTPMRVAIHEEEDNEFEAAERAALVKTPLRGTPMRVTVAEQEDDEEEEQQKVTTTKLASTPSKGPATRVTHAATPLKGPATRVAIEEVEEEEEPMQPTTNPPTKLAATPLKGPATRIAVATSPTSYDESAFLPPPAPSAASAPKPTSINSPAIPRKSAFTSTPLKSTPARVTTTVSEEGEEIETVVANPSTPTRKPFKVTGNSTVKPHTPKPSTPKNALLHLLNTGSEAELTILPGVGPKRATAIVKCRSESLFETASELTKAGVTQKQVIKILAFKFGDVEAENEENEEVVEVKETKTSRRRSVRA
ncbi:hypothetical protein TL16_g00541 [Triparma laevis f. inornata]|uniref:Uncharacterized protein n=1 Tax=Triparma laevis f. inornata TaxID=1714386 RepID=A0A9W7DP77_9STRA|nr:hypothetical protein TL16_g00541 [Triparma laevis f. inornata]